MQLRTNTSGYVDFSPEYLDWVRQQADFTEGHDHDAQPLQAMQALTAPLEQGCQCGGRCGCQDRPSVHSDRSEPLLAPKVMTR